MCVSLSEGRWGYNIWAKSVLLFAGRKWNAPKIQNFYYENKVSPLEKSVLLSQLNNEKYMHYRIKELYYGYLSAAQLLYIPLSSLQYNNTFS